MSVVASSSSPCFMVVAGVFGDFYGAVGQATYRDWGGSVIFDSGLGRLMEIWNQLAL